MTEQKDWQPPAIEPTGMTLDAGELPGIASEPGLLRAGGAGLSAAVAGAIVWAGITFTIKMQIGFMAIGLGFLVAYAVRRYGDRTTSHAVMSGALALFGCVLGNLLSTCAFYADSQSMPVLQVVQLVLSQPSVAVRLIEQTFRPMDAAFYAFACYQGFKQVAPRF
jgi:hypothetical protein